VPNRSGSDEAYILNHCDIILKVRGLRQHRFDFLKGDPGKTGRCVRLPVDAYYPPPLNFVIEYYEKQHTSSVPMFDNKPTISGVPRSQQRRIYDDRRRTVLPRNGIKLVELDYAEFRHGGNRSLIRGPEDHGIVKARIRAFLRTHGITLELD
jgi:hypothetical protein